MPGFRGELAGLGIARFQQDCRYRCKSESDEPPSFSLLG